MPPLRESGIFDYVMINKQISKVNFACSSCNVSLGLCVSKIVKKDRFTIVEVTYR